MFGCLLMIHRVIARVSRVGSFAGSPELMLGGKRGHRDPTQRRRAALVALAIATVALVALLLIPNGDEEPAPRTGRPGLPGLRPHKRPPFGRAGEVEASAIVAEGDKSAAEFRLLSDDPGSHTAAATSADPTSAPEPLSTEPVTSEWSCRSLLDPASAGSSETKVNVLGKMLPTAHFCVIRNACVDGAAGKLILFDPSAVEPRALPYPRQRAHQHNRSTIVQRDPLPFHLADRHGTLAGPRTLGVLAWTSSCCDDAFSQFEVVPTLHAAMRRIRRRPTESGLPNSTANLSVVVVTAGPPPADQSEHVGGWSTTGPLARWLLEFAVEGEDPGVAMQTHVKRVIDREQLGASTVCFRRLVVPGFAPSYFTNAQQATQMRDELLVRLERAKTALLVASAAAAAGGPGAPPPADAVVLGTRAPSARMVVMARRRPPHPGFVEANLVAGLLDQLLPAHQAESRIVDFDLQSVVRQAAQVQRASVFVAFGSDDLLHMLFMAPGSIVVELEPIFAEKPAVAAIAHSLRIKHAVWTCTTPRCGFGGDAKAWDAFTRATRITVDPETRQVIPSDAEPFVWPIFGTAETQCPECVQYSRTHPLLFGSQPTAGGDARSQVAVAHILDELNKLFADVVFPRVGWTARFVHGRWRP